MQPSLALDMAAMLCNAMSSVGLLLTLHRDHPLPRLVGSVLTA